MNAPRPNGYRYYSVEKYLGSQFEPVVETTAQCTTFDSSHIYQNMTADHMGIAQILTAGPLLAAVVTAMFAISKLSSDKAAKTTEFRKAWVESFRPAVATFVGTAHTIFGRIAIRQKHSDSKTQSNPTSDLDSAQAEGIFEFPSKAMQEDVFDKEFESELTGHWLSLRKSYSELVLHVNARDHGAYQFAEASVSAIKSSGGMLAEHECVAQYLEACIETAESQLLGYTTRPPFFERPRWIGAVRRRQINQKTNHSSAGKVESSHSGTAPVEGRGKFYSALHAGLEEARALDRMHGSTDIKDRLDLDTFRKKIQLACVTPDGAVLLATYATREYLHDEYRVVSMRGARIERGIRVIDTAAALMLKETWEQIKEGESSYNRGGLVLLALVVGVVATALMRAL